LIPAGMLNIPGFWLDNSSEALPQTLPTLAARAACLK